MSSEKLYQWPWPVAEPITLRDRFALQALGVMCASNVNATGTFATPDGRATVARICWLMADAMLDARGQGDDADEGAL